MPQLNEQMKEDMQKSQDRDEKDTEESEDASVAEAAAERTGDGGPGSDGDTGADPGSCANAVKRRQRRRHRHSGVTPEPTPEAAVQEQHEEAAASDAGTASDTGNSDYVMLGQQYPLSYQHRSDRYFPNGRSVSQETRFMPVTEEFSSRMIWQIILHPKAGIRQVYQQISLIIHI